MYTFCNQFQLPEQRQQQQQQSHQQIARRNASRVADCSYRVSSYKPVMLSRTWSFCAPARLDTFLKPHVSHSASQRSALFRMVRYVASLTLCADACYSNRSQVPATSQFSEPHADRLLNGGLNSSPTPFIPSTPRKSISSKIRF